MGATVQISSETLGITPPLQIDADYRPADAFNNATNKLTHKKRKNTLITGLQGKPLSMKNKQICALWFIMFIYGVHLNFPDLWFDDWLAD